MADELASGVLVQPFGMSLESFRYDLVYSSRRSEQAAVRVLRDWILAELGEGSGTVNMAAGK